MPTTAMDEKSTDFAVVCAVPVNAPGITMIFGRQASDDRRDRRERIDVGKPKFGSVGGEAVIAFEDVFVPKERVFMDGETAFTSPLVYRFAAHHRANYGACKTGLIDVLIGAVGYLTEVQGMATGFHVRDKITEMTHLSETLYSSSIACSAMGYKTPSGAYYPDPLLANTTKHNVTRHIYEISRLAHDIAGGIVATMPFQGDLESSEVGR